MKSLLMAVIYAAIVMQSEGCDIVKKYTGKEWHELPGGTKIFFCIAGVSLALLLFFIGQYLASPARPDNNK